MSPKPLDRRAKMTRELLKQSLIELMKDRPIHEIKPALVNDVIAVITENVEGAKPLSIDILNGESRNDYYVEVVCEIE